VHRSAVAFLALLLASALPAAALAQEAGSGAPSPGSNVPSSTPSGAQAGGSGNQGGSPSPQDMEKLLNEWHFYVQAGPAYTPDYVGSDDYSLYPMLIARVEKGARYLEFEGDTLRVNVLPPGLLHAGPVLHYERPREGVDDDRVNRLRHVRGAFMAGGFLRAEIRDLKELRRYVNLTLQVTQDVSGVNDGYNGKISLRGGGPLNDPWTIDTELFTDFGSSDFMSTYFGIDSDNAARSGFPTFHASEGFHDAGLSTMLTYHFDDHWGLGLIGQYSRLINDAAQSPVVRIAGSRDQFVAAVAVSYQY
jgi:outer membrane scaffolding protein for murein synthesis (MipA/OmpV family)